MRFKKQMAIAILMCVVFIQSGNDAHGAVIGPVAGYVFDAATRSIRPVIGVPGAAHLGAPEVSGVDFASIGSDGAIALAVKDAALFAVTGLGTASQGWVKIPGADAALENVTWSPDGTAAVSYSAKSARVQILRGPWTSPTADASIDTAHLGVRLAFGVIDSTTGTTIIGVRDAKTGGVYRIGQHSTPALLLRMNCPGAAVLSAQGTELFVTDCSGSVLFRMHNLAAQPVISGISLPVQRIAFVAGIALARDSQRLFVADGISRSITSYDARTGQVLGHVPLESTPASLQPLSGNGVFQVTSGDAVPSPLVLLETARRLKAWFVPAGTEDAHGQ